MGAASNIECHVCRNSRLDALGYIPDGHTVFQPNPDTSLRIVANHLAQGRLRNAALITQDIRHHDGYLPFTGVALQGDTPSILDAVDHRLELSNDQDVVRKSG